MLGQLPFKHILVVDFEYHQPNGSLPDPLCVVALELRTGTRIEQWLAPGDGIACPYDTDANAVLIGHNFTAETLCHLVRGWPIPIYVLDTYVEIKAAFNGKPFQQSRAPRGGGPARYSDDHLRCEGSRTRDRNTRPRVRRATSRGADSLLWHGR